MGVARGWGPGHSQWACARASCFSLARFSTETTAAEIRESEEERKAEQRARMSTGEESALVANTGEGTSDGAAAASKGQLKEAMREMLLEIPAFREFVEGGARRTGGGNASGGDVGERAPVQEGGGAGGGEVDQPEAGLTRPRIDGKQRESRLGSSKRWDSSGRHCGKHRKRECEIFHRDKRER